MKISYDSCKTISVPAADLVINAVAYADHDSIGGLLTLTSPFGAGVGLIVNSITIQDLDADNACPMVALFFEELPGSTTFTNNAIVALADADVPKVIHKAKIAASDYDALGTTCMVAEVTNLGFALHPRGPAGKFYMHLMSDGGTPTWAVGDLSLTVGVLIDPAS